MAGLADMFLQKAMTPQNTGYMNAYNQGEQQAYGRGLSGALASGAPREEVMAKASYVNPMGVLKMNEAQANAQATNINKNSQDPTLLKNVNQLGVQYRSYLNARYSKQYNEMTPQAQQGLNQSIEGIKQIMSKSELGQAMLGQVEQEVTPNLGVVETQAPQVDPELIKTEASELSQQLKDGAIDEDDNGLIDDIVGLSALVRSFGTKYGNATEAKGLSDLLDDLKENVANKFKASTESQKVKHSQGLANERQAKANEKELLNQDAEYKWLVGPIRNLDKDPNNTSYKLDALMTALRKESGAAIGADEFVGFMKINLVGDDLKRFNEETTGLKASMLGMLNKDVRDNHLKRIANKYLDRVSSEKIRKKLSDKIPDSYLERKLSTNKPKKGRFSKF